MPANPPTPPTVEPPEVATLREMLNRTEGAYWTSERQRETTAALRYALQLYGAVQAHVEALRDAKRLADHGDRRTAAMALNGSNARLAALLRPASGTPEEDKP